MNEQKNIDSQLSGLSKKNPFSTPEGYFESLQDRIEARIAEEDTVIPKKQQVFRLLKPMFSLAASFALIFLLVYYPLSKFLPSYLDTNQVTETIDVDFEENFITISLDENTFYETLTEMEDNTEPASEEILAYMSVKMTDYEIYNELINN